jgi:hypothetical protein
LLPDLHILEAIAIVTEDGCRVFEKVISSGHSAGDTLSLNHTTIPGKIDSSITVITILGP